MMLAAAAQQHQTAEAFVVSDVLWLQLERDAQDYVVERSGSVSTVPGLNQMAVMGVPVTRTRSSFWKTRPFAEMIHRPNGHSAEIVRLL